MKRTFIKTQAQPFHLKLIIGFLSAIIISIPLFSSAQVTISAGNNTSQNFDALGTSATAVLPSGWKIDKNTSMRTIGSYSSAVTATEFRAGNSMSSSAQNGMYNYAAGDATSATDRAIGGISSSSSSKSVNIYLQLTNNGSTSINSITISYDVEKYRNGTNSNGFTVQLYYSTDGSTWTTAGSDFTTSFAADADNNGFPTAPGSMVSVSAKTLSQSIATGNSLYLAWNYSATATTTSSNAQGLGIDNVLISAAGAALPTVSASPTSLSGFTYEVTYGPSSSESFSVSGSNLTANLAVTPSTNYDISLNNSSFSSSIINLIPLSGSVAATTIYTRLKSGLSANNYNEIITVSSTNATNATVSCNGSVSAPPPPFIMPNAWINEIHYDDSETPNAGDQNEMVEVVVKMNSDVTLSDLTVSLYNGSNGTVYDSRPLNLFTAGTVSGNYAFFYWYPTSIQNGDPDGIALDYRGTVIQFLSYEGTFMGTAGVANGITSTDIGVSESNSKAEGNSLQLVGVGLNYNHFQWIDPIATPGTVNVGQFLATPPPPVPVDWRFIAFFFVLMTSIIVYRNIKS